MFDGTLDKDLVSDASVCDMLVRVGTDSVDVAVFSVVADNSLIYRSFPVASPSAGVRALEDVVYDNPLMLCDFRKVSIIVGTTCYAVVPSDAADETSAVGIFRALHPAYSGHVSVLGTATRNASVVCGIESELSGFIGRTFHGASVMPHIVPLIRYFASKPCRGNSRRMVCNFRGTSFDIVMLDGNSLLQANTFAFSNPMDAVYYILASRSRHGLDPYNDEVLLTGDRIVREEVTPVLRRYISRVMPAIFPPQMFRAGKDAMLAPFDLIVTPLCE
ncbi:DUF3822 family protein [uncultured Duncaniella sp.]|uniref:DUF3822 family protein n=1 Tax=uncultured Duncaniella sp. TaxID=2768039 RepID=UPI0025D57874|nr:DUF3822 family protein [uncultured Duncaniella sp.]